MRQSWILAGLGVVLALAFVPRVARSGPETVADPFAPLEYLLGTWEGEGENPAGTATITRVFQPVFDGAFIQSHTRSVVPPGASSKGEVHQDLGMISYDQARKRIVLREFHSEGFVNQYLLTVEEDGDRLVWESETIENFVPGGRARLVQQVLSDDEIEESLELDSGGGYKVCTQSVLVRAD